MRSTWIPPLLLALTAGVAGAQGKDADTTPAPVDVVKAAQPGQWVAYDARSLAAAGRFTTSTQVRRTWTVLRREGAEVTIRVAGRADDGEERSREQTLPGDGTLTLEALLSRGELLEVKTEKATYTLRGRRFDCVRVDFQVRDELIEDRSIVGTVWLSESVPASGVVALVVRDRMERSTGVIEVLTWEEVSGFGDGERTQWGEAPR